MDVPLEAEPFMVRTLETAPTLRGSFRMANIPVGASQLLSWFLKFPLSFEDIRLTECDWTSTEPLSRLVDACGPKLRLLEIYVPLGLSYSPGTPAYLIYLKHFSRSWRQEYLVHPLSPQHMHLPPANHVNFDFSLASDIDQR